MPTDELIQRLIRFSELHGVIVKFTGQTDRYKYGHWNGARKKIVLWDGDCERKFVLKILLHEMGHWLLGHVSVVDGGTPRAQGMAEAVALWVMRYFGYEYTFPDHYIYPRGEDLILVEDAVYKVRQAVKRG